MQETDTGTLGWTSRMISWKLLHIAIELEFMYHLIFKEIETSATFRQEMREPEDSETQKDKQDER
jgi:hypothetical protein